MGLAASASPTAIISGMASSTPHLSAIDWVSQYCSATRSWALARETPIDDELMVSSGQLRERMLSDAGQTTDPDWLRSVCGYLDKQIANAEESCKALSAYKFDDPGVMREFEAAETFEGTLVDDQRALINHASALGIALAPAPKSAHPPSKRGFFGRRRSNQ
jgi:hypothetical protein